MSPADLDKLLTLAEAATPGPWIECMHGEVACRNSDGEIMRIIDCGELGEYNAAFIAACDPTTIKALVEELRRWRKSFGEWEAWK